MSLLSVDIINFMLTKLPLLDELRPQNWLKTKVFSAAYDTGSRFEIIYAVYIGYPLRKNSSGPFSWEPRSSMEEVFQRRFEPADHLSQNWELSFHPVLTLREARRICI
jgi:hypothetical protein